MDVFTILAMIIAFGVGIGFFYLYSKDKDGKVDKVFGLLKGVFDEYGERLKEDNPQLYGELEDAMNAMEKAMSDSRISISEAYDIALSILPLSKRLMGFVESRYRAKS